MLFLGMSMCVLGMSSEFKEQGVAFNALWPRTPISTSALLMVPGGDLGGTRKVPPPHRLNKLQLHTLPFFGISLRLYKGSKYGGCGNVGVGSAIDVHW